MCKVCILLPGIRGLILHASRSGQIGDFYGRENFLHGNPKIKSVFGDHWHPQERRTILGKQRKNLVGRRQSRAAELSRENQEKRWLPRRFRARNVDQVSYLHRCGVETFA